MTEKEYRARYGYPVPSGSFIEDKDCIVCGKPFKTGKENGVVYAGGSSANVVVNGVVVSMHLSAVVHKACYPFFTMQPIDSMAKMEESIEKRRAFSKLIDGPLKEARRTARRALAPGGYQRSKGGGHDDSQQQKESETD